MLFSLFKGRKKDAEVVDVLEARHDTCGEAHTEGHKDVMSKRKINNQ